MRSIHVAPPLLGALLTLAACGSSDGGRGDPQEEIPRPVALDRGEIGSVVGVGRRATDVPDVDADGKIDAPIPVLLAHLDTPMDVTFGPDGDMFVIDWNGHKIRSVDRDGNLAFLVGSGTEGDACEVEMDEARCPAIATELNHPTDITFSPDGRLFIAAWHNSKIKVCDTATESVENLCGTGGRKFEGDGGPCRDDTGKDLVSFDLPSSVAFDGAGNLFIADQANQVVRRLGTDGVVKTVAGACPGTMGFGCLLGRGYFGDGGPATSAGLDNDVAQGTDPQGKIEVDSAGNLYIADTGNNVVRKVVPGTDGVLGDGDLAEEIITTLVGTGEPGASGDGGPANEAQLNAPTDVAVASDGTLYIADRANSCVRKVTPEGTISTVAGRCGEAGFEGEGALATDAALFEPYGVELDSHGDLYIADTRNHRIRKVRLTD